MNECSTTFCVKAFFCEDYWKLLIKSTWVFSSLVKFQLALNGGCEKKQVDVQACLTQRFSVLDLFSRPMFSVVVFYTTPPKFPQNL